jgi:putative membrane protein
MATRIVGLLTIGVAGVLAATACKKTESVAGDSIARSGTGATAAVSATGGSTAAGGAGAASAASSGLTDANIVYILDQANAADSARGRVAQTKATNAEVKSFGRLMVGEHHALRQQGQALAKKLNVTPERPASDQSEAQAKQEMDSLNALAKGKAWDKAYIDYEVGYHQAVLQTATKALDAAQNQELKDLIKKAAPVIQHHLDRAQAIQKKLGT